MKWTTRRSWMQVFDKDPDIGDICEKMGVDTDIEVIILVKE